MQSPKLVPEILSERDLASLLDYMDTDDERTDVRPDVRSKHPRWNVDLWPQTVIEKTLDTLLSVPYEIEEVTFQRTRIGLRPHVDNAAKSGRHGITLLYLLHAHPTAHTVFFDQRLTNNQHAYGAFLQKTPWSPFSYRLPKGDKFVFIEDLRQLLTQCREAPETVTDFTVTQVFIDQLETLIRKRGQPQLDLDKENTHTGFCQPSTRLNDYSIFEYYVPGQPFDPVFHQTYLHANQLQDLEGLTVQSVIEWQPRSVMVFDRNQVHCSSDCHGIKTMINVFCSI